MNTKHLPLVGVSLALLIVFAATLFFPGGYDWNKDFISSLFHAGSETSRWTAIAGVLLFWITLAFMFERLVRTAEFKPDASWLRMTGHGSCVYGSLIVTPMHDLMISITVAFLTGTLILLLKRLIQLKRQSLILFGAVTSLLLFISAVLYYAGQLEGPLPWVQRGSFICLACWMLAIDYSFVSSRAATD